LGFAREEEMSLFYKEVNLEVELLLNFGSKSLEVKRLQIINFKLIQIHNPGHPKISSMPVQTNEKILIPL